MPRGPQSRYVRDENGREVHGLCQEKVTRNGTVHYRYYAWYTEGGKRRKKHLGTSNNKVAAIFAFRQWEARQQQELIEFRVPPAISVGDQVVTPKPGQSGIDVAVLQEVLQADELFALTAGRQVKLPADLVWKKIGQIIMNDPRLAAQRTGIPELARLHTLPIPTEPLALSEIRDAYLTHKSFKYARQKQDAQSAWDQFTKAVGCSTVEQIAPADLARYHKTITGQGYAARTVKNLIRIIQAFLNYAAAIHKSHRPQLLELKQDIRAICRIPKQKELSPKPMDKDHYLTLLKAVEWDKKWYAMLLTALNLALHGTELAEVQTDEVNLRACEFSTHRTKTGVARVAKLWDRTVNAIREYQNTDHFKHNRTKYLYTNKNNQLYNILRINQKIRRLRAKAGLPSTVVFDGIRDLFRRAAGAKDFVATKWVMGHSLGIDDVYAFRDVAETVETMRRVETYVFSAPQRKSQKRKATSPSPQAVADE
jgi:site-specific recombinase XerD